MLEKKRNRLAAVVGPTVSGKTALAAAIALGFDGEVVSADSMQIYRGMDIATAKPTVKEMRGVPHHLLDFVDPGERFSVASYVEMARACIEEIHGRGKLPVVAGGTGLYIRSLLENIEFTQAQTDYAYREELRERAAKEGGEILLAELRTVDPEAAANLHPNNQGRIIRALELYNTTGLTVSEHNRLSRQHPSAYDACVIGLSYRDRDLLYERIDRRVDRMLSDGLLEEAKAFYRDNNQSTAVQAIGYKELKPYLDGQMSLEDAVETLKRETRRYAKRQLTWFRKDEGIRWIYIDELRGFDEAISAAFGIIAAFLEE